MSGFALMEEGLSVEDFLMRKVEHQVMNILWHIFSEHKKKASNDGLTLVFQDATKFQNALIDKDIN